MKMKAIALGIVTILIIAGGLIAIDAQPSQGTGPKKPGQDFSGPHYNLNIIGKKDGWNGNAGIDPDTSRHTMFVPIDTSDIIYEDPYGHNLPIDTEDPYDTNTGIIIWMTKGDEFAVLDGNAFDDDQCSFQVPDRTYTVYICAKAKNPKYDDPYTDITGWVQYDENGDAIPDYFYYEVGKIRVKGKQWYDITDDLFYVTDTFTVWDGTEWITININDMWIFDFVDYMEGDPTIPGDGYWDDVMYFWQFDNHGNKLVKLRFYPD